MPPRSFPGPERRKFRRLDLRYPVHIEVAAKEPSNPAVVVEGVTVNISFGGALIGVADSSGLGGAMPVEITFDQQGGGVRPAALHGVVWRLEGDGDGDESLVAVEFDDPLLAYQGSVELAERIEWLRDMGGDEFVRDIIDLFLDSVPPNIRLARELGASGDLHAVAQVARSIKSSAGNIGAVNLYELARRIEAAALRGDVDATRSQLGRLPDYLDAVRAELERGPGV